jgi:hypothetical protein
MPDTNVFTYDIETENLTCHFQDSLSDFERDSLGALRPDSVCGGYVVCHTRQAGNHLTIIGRDTLVAEYAAGQAFVIYRPRAFDKSDTAWCDLNIDQHSGCLSITVDRSWLHSATYPVTIDPTFGNSDIGASSMDINQIYAYCHRLGGINTHVVASNTTATVTGYSIYGSETGSGVLTVPVTSFDIVSGLPADRVAAPVDVTISGGTAGWCHSETASHQLLSDHEYGMAVGCAPRSGGRIYYNSVTAATSTDNTNCELGSTSWSPASMTAFNYSMYATCVEQTTTPSVVTRRRKMK